MFAGGRRIWRRLQRLRLGRVRVRVRERRLGVLRKMGVVLGPLILLTVVVIPLVVSFGVVMTTVTSWLLGFEVSRPWGRLVGV